MSRSTLPLVDMPQAAPGANSPALSGAAQPVPSAEGLSGGSSISQKLSGEPASPPAERDLFSKATETPHAAGTLAPAHAASDYSMGGYFQGIGVLFLMLCLMWGIVHWMKKSGKFRFMPVSGSFPRDGLRMESQLPLGPRKGLVVVRFLDKRLLLGVTDQQITLVAEREYHDEAEGETGADVTKGRSS